MKTANNRIRLIAIAALLLVGSSAALVSRVRALPLCPSCRNLRFTFGMLDITAGQTARLNVVNALPQPPPIYPSPPPTRLTLMFVDGNGNPFNIAGAPLQTTVTLGPGQSAFLDLNGDALPVGPPVYPSPPPQRVQIRAVLPSCDGCDQGFVIPTLEMFDNATGKTTLVVPDTPAIARVDGTS